MSPGSTKATAMFAIPSLEPMSDTTSVAGSTRTP